ncbi:MAG: endodeoxyribonuclease RusA [Neobacillus sp.]|nr:endodeoxyribonuclease RusA [Neobacillus sp.]
MIRLTILGEPQGKARARTVKNKHTGKTMSFTPENTVSYENLIKHEFLANGCEKLTGEIVIKVIAFFSIPKSTSNTKQCKMNLGTIRPTKKPDVDNICKICADALNKIAYDDDSQIVSAIIQKFYSDRPRVEIELSEI